MGEFIVAGLSNYSWVFVCLFLVGWALVRWAHYRLNKATLKPRFNPKKERSYSKRLNFYLRYFKRATTGRNYEKTSTKLDIYLFCVFIGSIVLVPIGLFLDGTRSWSISPDPMEWGVVGDFFGGTLNPILAFASFIALLYTIRIQSEELRLTREEFAKSVEAQKIIAETAKSELSLAKEQFATQSAMQIVQPFLNKVSDLLLECEGVLRRKVKTNEYSEQSQLEVVIKKYANGSNLSHFSNTLAIVSILQKQASNGLSVIEIDEALTELKRAFLELWNAALNVDNVLSEAGLAHISNKILGIFLNKMATVGAYLHVTGKFKQDMLDDFTYQFGAAPLIDHYIQKARECIAALDTSKN